MFAGIGGFRSALDPLGGECVFASEIDPFATRAYRALYNGASELSGDITKIGAADIPDHDVLVGGFPCQAFSVAGQRKGFEEARGTLFFEIARIAKTKQPRLMLLENVKGLLSHDGGRTFETMCSVLNDIGYAIDFRVLNSKHYGVPQNRERIFVVCDHDAEHAEWNAVGNGVEAKAKRRAQALGIRTFNFDWPSNNTVTMRLRDVLEAQVDEKYYLSEEKTAKLIAQLNGHKSEVEDVVCLNPRKVDGTQTYQQDRVYESDGVMTTLSAELSGCFNITESPIIAGSLEHYGNDQMNRVYSVDGVAPTITVVSGGGREQKIAEPIIEKIGHLPSDSGQTGTVYNSDGIAPTCLNQHGNAVTKIAEIQEFTVIQKTHSTTTTFKFDEVGTLQAARLDKVPQVVTEVRAVLTPDRPEKRQNGRRFKDDGEESFTLTAQDKHGVAVGTYPRYRIRKLTPRECWRLQGFSDKAHDTVAAAGISDSQRYKQAGNAVTVNVISAISVPLIERLIDGEVKLKIAA